MATFDLLGEAYFIHVHGCHFRIFGIFVTIRILELARKRLLATIPYGLSLQF